MARAEQPDTNDVSTVDLAAAIRNRREELFGPKKAEPADVPAPVLNDSTLDTSPRNPEAVQAKYEMELGAHRDTTDQLLEAKNALIAQLEAAIRDRDTTIGQLRSQLNHHRTNENP